MLTDIVVQKLKAKRAQIQIDPGNLLPLGQALWVLEILKDFSDFEQATAYEISTILLKLEEIKLGEKKIINAFSRAGSKINTDKAHGATHYEIMRSGRTYLHSLVGDKSALEEDILYFSGKNAWTDANHKLPVFIELLKGELLIVDPFYGDGTFHVLSIFGKERKIRFLTRQLGSKEKGNPTSFQKNLDLFKKEFPNIKMKIFIRDDELHDRYIISDNGLTIIGHGIKDISTKETFIIFMDKNKVGELVNTLRNSFNARWNESTNI